MSTPGDNWIVPGANPYNQPGGVDQVLPGTNVTISGTPSKPVVNSSAASGVTTVEGVAGIINLNGVGMTIAGGTPVAQDITFTAAVQSIASSNASVTVTQPTPGNYNLAVASTGAPTIQKIVNSVPINPVAQASGSQKIVPIANPPGITFASLGIAPSLYNFIEVSMGFNAMADINTCVWSFYALANDGAIGSSYGDSIYIAFAGNMNPYYVRFTMSKAAGHFTNSSTTFNMIKDDTIGPFPNGFILYNTPYLQMGVRAFN
jgi:hypothetical protein